VHLSNLVSLGAKAAAFRLLGRRSPAHVMLSLTNRCPMRCAYCDIPSREQHELTTDEILALVDGLAEAGVQRLGLWGGEPLVHDGLAAILDRCRGRGIYTTLDTSGLYLAKRWDRLRSLDHLIVSIDGPEGMHDLNRGRGTYRVAAEALRFAAGQPDRKPLWTITVLTRHNLAGIDHVLDLAREVGALSTFQVLHHGDAMARGHEDLFPDPGELREAIRHLARRKRQGAPIASTWRYLDHLLSWDDLRVPHKEEKHRDLECVAGRLYANVDADGTVYPCSVMIEQVPGHSVRRGGFQRAWDALEAPACQACTASCYTEYNYLFTLDPATVAEWVSSFYLRRGGRTAGGVRTVEGGP